MSFFIGTPDNDDLHGDDPVPDDDTFDMSDGGNDTVDGLTGDDVVLFGSTYTLDDNVFGGAGGDVITLEGDYADLIFFGSNIDGIEQISLLGNFTYSITMFDDALGAGDLLNFDGGTLGPGQHFEFDGAGEVEGSFFVTGSSGDDMIAGGGGNDEIFGGAGDDFISPGSESGKNVVDGGAGADTIFYGGVEQINAKDRVDGGAGPGKDTLRLFSDYSGGFVFGAHTISNIERVQLNGGNSYVLDLTKIDFTTMPSLSVLGDFVGPNDVVSVTAKGAQGVNIEFHGGAGKDVFVGSDGADIFLGNAGADSLTGGAGTDTFSYRKVADSKGKVFDTVTGFDANSDFLDVVLPGEGGAQHVTGVDAMVTSGTLTKATLNPDLEAAIGAGQMAEDHAVLFTPDAGGFAGSVFLIIDGNNVAGYQGNADIVIRLVDGKHINAFDIDNFGTPG